jgi:hypothetical protein
LCRFKSFYYLYVLDLTLTLILRWLLLLLALLLLLLRPPLVVVALLLCHTLSFGRVGRAKPTPADEAVRRCTDKTFVFCFRETQARLSSPFLPTLLPAKIQSDWSILHTQRKHLD